MISGFTGFAFPIIKIKTTESVVASTAPTVNVPGQPPAPTTMMMRTTSYKHYGTFGFGARAFSLENYYQESMYYLSYGRPVGNKWAWGVSAKYLQENYILDQYMMASPVFGYGSKDSVSNVSFDAGLIYNIAPRFYAGISALDINQPDLGLLYEDKLPCTVRTGIAWREKGLSWALDAVYSSNEWIYSTGFEKFIGDVFGVRMGVGYGGMNYFNIAAGFSMNISRAQIDYSFEYPVVGIESTAGTHRISLVFKFGRKKKEELEAGSLEYYYAKAKDDVTSLSQQLAETKSEKDNLEKILIEESTLRIRERIKAAKSDAKTGSNTSSAPAEGKESKETRHIVRDGETLQSIAHKYFGDEKFWNDIYQANKDSIGRGGTLKVNQVLIIPTLAQQENQSVAALSPSPVANQVVPIKVIETPSTVATLPGVSPDVIPIKVIPIKVIGQENSTTTADSKLQEAKKASKITPQKPRKHIVQEGENLRSIAQKYYNDPKRWKDIYKANKSKIISGQVTPGMEIIIP